MDLVKATLLLGFKNLKKKSRVKLIYKAKTSYELEKISKNNLSSSKQQDKC